MPIIETPSPLQALSDTLTGYQQGNQEKNAERDLQLQRQMEMRQLSDTEQQNAVQNQFQQRQLDLQQKQSDAQIASQQINDAINKATLAHLPKQYALADQLARDQITGNLDQHKLASYTLRAKQLEDQYVKKLTGAPGIDAATIAAQLKMYNAQIANYYATQAIEKARLGIEQQQANTSSAEAQANIGLTHAETQEAKARTKMYSTNGGLTPYQQFQERAAEGRMGMQLASRVNSAINQLHAQSIDLPDDPNIGQAIQQFSQMNRAERTKELKDPRIPPETRDYLMKLSAFLP